MAICPFAAWIDLPGQAGTYTGGPFKIVHHTTEGPTAQSAFEAFRKNRSKPHFTVDATEIYQHVDTMQSARSLRNPPGGVETNRDSAVQIEVVGFAHLPKGAAALTNVARLCRWIEQQHSVPRIWPNGLPKPAVNGRDPGGHNRDAAVWVAHGGHYGHCHVPENEHWDPGYTSEEVRYLMSAEFDTGFTSFKAAMPNKLPELDLAVLMQATSTMDGHEIIDGESEIEAAAMTDLQGASNEDNEMATNTKSVMAHSQSAALAAANGGPWENLRFTLHYGWLDVKEMFTAPGGAPGGFELIPDVPGAPTKLSMRFGANQMRPEWTNTEFEFRGSTPPSISQDLPKWVDEDATGPAWELILRDILAELRLQSCTLKRIEGTFDGRQIVRGIHLPGRVQTTNGPNDDIFMFAVIDPEGGPTPDGGGTGPPPRP